MNELVAVLMLWIVNNSGYTAVGPPEDVKTISNICITIGQPAEGCPYGGRYIPELNEIWLKGTFDKDDVFSRATLVHELTHYFQDMFWTGGLHDDIAPEIRCKSAEEAYRLQAKYLLEHTGTNYVRFSMSASLRVCRYAWARWREQHPFEVKP